MIRKILTYPDKRLFLRSLEVKLFDDNLARLLDDMYESMIENYGIGLAAIQVNEPLRALIIELPPEDEDSKEKGVLYEFINPVYEKIGEESVINNEGCLSVPGFFEDVRRHKSVKLSYQDRYGEKKELIANDFLAVAIQHECDHLDGHLFIEKLSFLKRKKFEKEFKKNLKKRL